MTNFQGTAVLSDKDRLKFAHLIAAAWSDEKVRARFEREPRTVSAEYGVVIPEGVPTPLLPVRPKGELTIEKLGMTSGTASLQCVGTSGSIGATMPCQQG
ncbi:hypothetical protein [Herbidospora sp. RD11066]